MHPIQEARRYGVRTVPSALATIRCKESVPIGRSDQRIVCCTADIEVSSCRWICHESGSAARLGAAPRFPRAAEQGARVSPSLQTHRFPAAGSPEPP